MDRPIGTSLSRDDMNKIIPNASKIFSKIERINGGMRFTLSKTAYFFGYNFTVIKDNSVAYVTYEKYQGVYSKGIIDVVHFYSPGNTLRQHPFDIYINDHLYIYKNNQYNPQNHTEWRQLEDKKQE